MDRLGKLKVAGFLPSAKFYKALKVEIIMDSEIRNYVLTPENEIAA